MIKRTKNKKGFTLAELLLVVAIIAVLVAISIPIFTAQLEKSREATDMSNLRAAYAECSAAVMTGEGMKAQGNLGECQVSNGTATCTVTMVQKSDGWLDSNKDITIGGVKLSDISDPKKPVTVTVKSDGTCKLGQ